MNFSVPGSSIIFGQTQLGRVAHNCLPLAIVGLNACLIPATPGGMTLTCFAEASGPEPQPTPSGAGPVLVMPPAKPPRHRWLQRVWLVVFVLFCLEIGILLTVLPWTSLWTSNSLLASFPAVKQFLSNNFFRGVVSGLGLVDIWMGVAEAVTYRESPRT
jgi:hypothetical protein